MLFFFVVIVAVDIATNIISVGLQISNHLLNMGETVRQSVLIVSYLIGNNTKAFFHKML